MPPVAKDHCRLLNIFHVKDSATIVQLQLNLVTQHLLILNLFSGNQGIWGSYMESFEHFRGSFNKLITLHSVLLAVI